MSQMTDSPVKTFAVSGALGKYRRVKLAAGVLALAGSTDHELGTLEEPTFSTSTAAGVRLRTAQGTAKMIASEAITAGNPVYAAADGEIAASGTVLLGTALEAATTDQDVIEVLRRQETSDSAAAGGTTAAAFLVDSDATTPKIELAAQTGGTGNYKATIKPPATLTGNRVATLPVDADATLLSNYCQTVTPNSVEGAGNSILPNALFVDVAAVTNDANDFCVLPPIASVNVGHTIHVAVTCGTNCELRTPATSNTKINGVDADGSQEYLCTDTDLIRATSMGATQGWIVQSITAAGAVRTAVVPD